MTKYRIAPASRRNWDLAGEGNSFADEAEACRAAESLDEVMPLDDGDEWCVYESTCGGWINITRPRRGRPPKPPEDRAVPLGMVRVPGRMLARLREAAEARGMTLTEWVQLALRHELER